MLFVQRMIQKALIIFSFVFLISCSNYSQLQKTAQESYQKGKYADAIEDADDAILKLQKLLADPNNKSDSTDLKNTLASLYILKGNAYQKQNRSNQSKQSFLEAVSYIEEDETGYFDQVWILLEQNEGERAKRILQTNRYDFSRSDYLRLLSIASFISHRQSDAYRYFIDSVNSGFSYNNIVSNRRSNFSLPNRNINHAQNRLLEYIRDTLSKSENSKLRSLSGVIKQYDYITQRKKGKFGEFGLPNSYLTAYNKISFTTRDIVLTKESKDCVKIILLGSSCETTIYAGKVLKNDIVQVNGNSLTTMHNTNDITRTASGEASGSFYAFTRERGLRSKQLFTKNKPSKMAAKYYPTSFSQKDTNWEGGILGFIERHPIASLVIGAGVASLLSSDSGDSYSSNDTSTTSNSCGDLYTGARVTNTGFMCRWYGKVESCSSSYVSVSIVWADSEIRFSKGGTYSLDPDNVKIVKAVCAKALKNTVAASVLKNW